MDGRVLEKRGGGRGRAAALAMALFGAGCASERAALVPFAGEARPPHLAEGEKAFFGSDYQAAETELALFLEEPRSPLRPYARLLQGLARLKLERYDEARKDLTEALAFRFPDDLDAAARMAFAEGEFRRRRYREAETLFRDLLARHPGRIPEDSVKERLRSCLVYQEKFDEAAAIEIPPAPPAANAPPSPPPVLPLDPSVKTEVYAVQCGAYAKKAFAEDLLLRLGRQKVDSRIVEAAGPRGPLFHVRAGAFEKRVEAEAKAGQIRALKIPGLKDPFVVLEPITPPEEAGPP